MEAVTAAAMLVLRVNADAAACFPDLAQPRQALTTQANSCFYCSGVHIGSICFDVSAVVCAIAIDL